MFSPLPASSDSFMSRLDGGVRVLCLLDRGGLRANFRRRLGGLGPEL